MKQKLKILLITLVQLTAVPMLSYGQYFNKQYDYDSTFDWGWNLFLRSDGNYFIEGKLLNKGYRWALVNMLVATDGKTLLDKHIIQYDKAYMYDGNSGEAKAIIGGYITPLTVQCKSNPYSTGNGLTSSAGLIKYNFSGDTVFLKTYTDTLKYYEGMITCAIMNDGGYIIGGVRGLNTPSISAGYIIRTNGMGDTIWTHTYEKATDQRIRIDNIIPLQDGRIAVAATSTLVKNPGGINEYYLNQPWFLLLDDRGNVIRDTLYKTGYQGGGYLNEQVKDGYISAGALDDKYAADPTDIRNFTNYIALMDTNFRVKWLTKFPNSLEQAKLIWVIKQLHNGDYIVLGDQYSNEMPQYLGWAARVSSTGTIKWSNTYRTDTGHDTRLRGVVELPDGNLVFTGMAYNPVTKDRQDIWLLGLDSNGCENGLCAPVGVKTPTIEQTTINIYPNPAIDELTIATEKEAYTSFTITNSIGQVMMEQPLTSVQINVSVKALPAGLYYISLRGNQGVSVQKFVKL